MITFINTNPSNKEKRDMEKRFNKLLKVLKKQGKSLEFTQQADICYKTYKQ